MLLKETMDLRQWNGLQMVIFKKYGIQNNLSLLQKIAKHLGELEVIKDIDSSNNMIYFESIVKQYVESVVVNDIESIINSYQSKAELEHIYTEACSTTPSCECDIEDYRNHLISKVELYKEFGTDRLHDTVVEIVTRLH